MLDSPLTLPRPLLITLIAALALATAAFVWRLPAQRAIAPTVSYTLLDGRASGSESWRGKVVLVNFWATTCAVCVAEMPEIAATHVQFNARGFDTVAVAMRYDPPALVARFAAARALPFSVAIDNTGEIAQRFGDVELTPTSFLIDKHGKIVARVVGKPDFAELHRLIDRLLAEA
jgi:thiol-disulfide isomerase/thioredoxin